MGSSALLEAATDTKSPPAGEAPLPGTASLCHLGGPCSPAACRPVIPVTDWGTEAPRGLVTGPGHIGASRPPGWPLSGTEETTLILPQK